ncbi:5-oxoprolinase subunit PxpB [Terrihabitans sp. B22-R8]|uniref:5-oxoprolinase subunit PxpB n=1 Tax=Terrihabitans sp. B22-R8 TaxID=3425128 RepID=UPI00403C38E9
MEINLIERLRPLGDGALTCEFRPGEDRLTSRLVHAAARMLGEAALPGVHDIVPAFRSLTVHFDPDLIDHGVLAQHIRALQLSDDVETASGRTWRVPVLYGGEGGPDLAETAHRAGLAEAEIIRLHASIPYHVYMLGFLPGFAYLGDLPEQLRLPRLADPRTRVPAGSVAIAESMTAIYPSASPGGWRLIGRSPFPLFDAARNPPCPLAAGDRVVFHPVTSAEFDDLARASAAGFWPEPEP